MQPLSPATLAILVAVAGAAGVVDAIAGGGGLLTVPALLAAGLPEALALGTNKGQSLFGASGSLARFARSPLLDRSRALASFVAGAAGAVTGVGLLQLVPNRFLRPLVLVLLIGAAVNVLVQRPPPPGQPRPRSAPFAALVAFVLGCYDGFFGPGVGTLLILAYARWWRDPYPAASANAKVTNCASNLGALVVFAWLGRVLWLPALAMGAAQLVGGWLGAHLVVRRGQGLVRTMAVTISLAVVAKLVWQMVRGA